MLYFDAIARDLSCDALIAYSRPRHIALTCVQGHRFCGNCDSKSRRNGKANGCAHCERASGVERKMSYAGSRTPMPVYFANIAPSPVYKSFDPSRPQCLACSHQLEIGSNEALVCCDGHRFCYHCAVGTDEALCPECYSISTTRQHVGHPFGSEVYYYGCAEHEAGD